MKKNFVLVPCFIMTFFALFVAIGSFDKSILATIFALTGFTGFLVMSIVFTYRLRKHPSKNSSN